MVTINCSVINSFRNIIILLKLKKPTYAFGDNLIVIGEHKVLIISLIVILTEISSCIHVYMSLYYHIPHRMGGNISLLFSNPKLGSLVKESTDLSVTDTN